jgi:hemerythrin
MPEKLVLLPVPLKPEDREAFSKAAEADGHNMAQLVRTWIAEYMRTKDQAFTSDTLKHGGKREQDKQPA